MTLDSMLHDNFGCLQRKNEMLSVGDLSNGSLTYCWCHSLWTDHRRAQARCRRNPTRRRRLRNLYWL